MGQTEIVGRTSGVAYNVLLALSIDQGNINANTVVVLVDDIAGVTENNGIIFNNTTHRASLNKGETYKLQAYTRHWGNPNNTAADYRWYDVTNAIFIGVKSQIASLNSLTNDGQQPVVSATITPDSDIEVELRCLAVSAPNQGLRSDATYATIETITSGTPPLIPPVGQGEIVITDADIITTIINPDNWTDGNYTGSVIGLIAVNIYYNDAENLKYIFDGTTLRRFTYNSAI